MLTDLGREKMTRGVARHDLLGLGLSLAPLTIVNRVSFNALVAEHQKMLKSQIK